MKYPACWCKARRQVTELTIFEINKSGILVLFFFIDFTFVQGVYICAEFLDRGGPATGDETGETSTCKQMNSDLLDTKLTGLRARQFVGDSRRVRVPGSILKLEEAAEGARAGWMDSSDCKLISKLQFNCKFFCIKPHTRTTARFPGWVALTHSFFLFLSGVWYSAQVDSSRPVSGKGVWLREKKSFNFFN